jgi:hypothetical protein
MEDKIAALTLKLANLSHDQLDAIEHIVDVMHRPKMKKKRTRQTFLPNKLSPKYLLYPAKKNLRNCFVMRIM